MNLKPKARTGWEATALGHTVPRKSVVSGYVWDMEN